MSITIKLYNVSDENNTINKTLGTSTDFSGTIRDPGSVDVVHPEILIESNIYGYNYAYIDEFHRYYYITELTQVRNGLCMLSLESDPLMSFASDILALPAIAGRVSGGNGELFNSYLHDEKMRLLSADICGTWVIHSFAYGNQYVLVTAG